MPAKKRKKHKSPQPIEPATWDAVKAACVAGIGYSEAARVFGIRSPHAIIMKSRRDRWPIPNRVEQRVQALQARLQRRSKAAQERRNGNEEVIQTVAESWAERGEMHRQLAFQIATGELKKVAHAPPPVDSWRDLDVLDRIGRRSAGLDDSERNQTINIGMQMVEARLINLSLPPDALPGDPKPPVSGALNPLR
jgi:hypothetical protein